MDLYVADVLTHEPTVPPVRNGMTHHHCKQKQRCILSLVKDLIHYPQNSAVQHPGTARFMDSFTICIAVLQRAARPAVKYSPISQLIERYWKEDNIH